jgi:rhomboid protease GluP
VRVAVPTHSPLWTPALIVVNVAVFVAMTALGDSEDPITLIQFGAKYNPLIIAGEYWRLLTAIFIHIGLVHLFFNSYALYVFGTQVEQRFGHTRFLALYLLSGLGGAVASFVGNPSLSAGASGAIFGLLGTIIVYYASYRAEFGERGRRQLTSLLVVAGLNLFWGLVNPGIDNLAHIGGLVSGLVLGWAYRPNYRVVLAVDSASYTMTDEYNRSRAWLVSLVLIVLLVVLSYLVILAQR